MRVKRLETHAEAHGYHAALDEKLGDFRELGVREEWAAPVGRRLPVEIPDDSSKGEDVTEAAVELEGTLLAQPSQEAVGEYVAVLEVGVEQVAGDVEAVVERDVKHGRASWILGTAGVGEDPPVEDNLQAELIRLVPRGRRLQKLCSRLRGRVQVHEAA